MARNIEITVGRLLCGTVRDQLSSAKYKGSIIDFHETAGLFERDFIVTCSDDQAPNVRNWMDRLIRISEGEL